MIENLPSMTFHLKGSIFLKKKKKKKDIFFIQERFNKLIYNSNTIIECDIWHPVKFQLGSKFWTGSKMKCFYRIS